MAVHALFPRESFCRKDGVLKPRDVLPTGGPGPARHGSHASTPARPRRPSRSRRRRPRWWFRNSARYRWRLLFRRRQLATLTRRIGLSLGGSAVLGLRYLQWLGEASRFSKSPGRNWTSGGCDVGPPCQWNCEWAYSYQFDHLKETPRIRHATILGTIDRVPYHAWAMHAGGGQQFSLVYDRMNLHCNVLSTGRRACNHCQSDPSCSRRLDFALTALRAEFDSYCVPKEKGFKNSYFSKHLRKLGKMGISERAIALFCIFDRRALSTCTETRGWDMGWDHEYVCTAVPS